MISVLIASCGSGVESSRRSPGQLAPGQSNGGRDLPGYQGQPFGQGAQPPARGSGGRGGATGLVEATFTASNQKSSNYKTRIPADVSQKLYGLTIHLHGDGGGDYRWLFEDNVRIGLEHDLIGIVVLAPNAERRWYRQGEQNARFLHELIQNEIAKKYDIDLNRVYFSGVSGGSQFLTGQFIPLYGRYYRSGAVMLCGGPENWQSRLDMGQEDIKSFRLSWLSTAGDFLLDQVEEGISYYQAQGFPVKSEILRSGEHCDFPGGIDGALERKIKEVLHESAD
ncbi:MAG: hypothetical protein RIQ81_1629 [Pseudomonadota bacterium]